MGKKILIHTQKALPQEDFIADIQLPLNAKVVNGMVVNAYDREKGVTISWGYEQLEPGYSVAAFLNDHKGLPEYLGRNVLEEGAGEMLQTEAVRDQFIEAVVRVYIQGILTRETDPARKTIFTQPYLEEKLSTLKQFVNKGYFANGQRTRWNVWLGVNKATTVDGTVIYGTTEPLRFQGETKYWNPEDLKAWYRNFEKFMASNATATTPNYRETFFDEPANFAAETFEEAKVYIPTKTVGPKQTLELVNAYFYFGNLYGYPDATWFGYDPILVQNFTFDPYETARIALDWYFSHITYQREGNYWVKNVNWDRSNVGELSVLFNSGRDIAIRDIPIDLNTNFKTIHYDLISLTQKEQVNSFVRLVFKNNGKARNPFYVKVYFFFETY